MSRLLRDSALVSIAEIAGAVAALLNGVIIARATGAEGRGVYTLAISLAILSSTALGLRWERAVGHFQARDPRYLAPIAGSVLLMGLLAASLGFGLWFLWPGLIQEKLLGGAPASIVILSLSMIFTMFSHNSLLALQAGMREFGTRARYSVAVATVQVLPLAVLWALGVVDVFWYLAVQFAGFAVLSVTWLSGLLMRGRVRPTLDFSLMRRMAQYSGLVYMGVLLDVLSVKVDVFFISAMRPPETSTVEVGVYTAAVGLATQIIRIPNLLGHVVFARTSANELGSGPATARLIRLAGVVMLLAGGFMALIGRWLIWALYGPEFAEAIKPLYILIPALMFLGIFRLIASDIDGRGMPARVSVCTFLTATTVTVLDILWIPRFGILGASWASLLAFGAGCLAISATFCRLTGQGWAEAYLPRISDARLLVERVGSVRRKRGRGAGSGASAAEASPVIEE